jgi:hypothetical protein
LEIRTDFILYKLLNNKSENAKLDGGKSRVKNTPVKSKSMETWSGETHTIGKYYMKLIPK